MNPFAGVLNLFLLKRGTYKIYFFPSFLVSLYNDFGILRLLNSLEPLTKAANESCL